MATMTSGATRRKEPGPEVASRRIALAGNPNAGKTTLFNALTGMRQKVGNYPGVTVEKKEGRCAVPDGADVLLLDLPGTYSLAPASPDEEIARDVLLGLREETPPPDAVVVVVDASNLERNLYLATQVLELGLPTVIALNMSDMARKNGKPVDAARLSRELGAPVVEVVAVRGEGISQLRAHLATVPAPVPKYLLPLPAPIEAARDRLAEALRENASEATLASNAEGLALRLLASEVPTRVVSKYLGAHVAHALAELRADTSLRFDAVRETEAKARHAMLRELAAHALERPAVGTEGDDLAAPDVAARLARSTRGSWSDRADRVLMHPFWGLAIFALIGLLVLHAIFVWASYPMDWIDRGLSALGDLAVARLPDGPLRDLLVEGVIAGVGAVVTFVPQIAILFFFIGLLEDTGYMARAACLMDRMMSRVGLPGRAFIPLMSSFACAIPGITATRTIANPRDRLATILIAPFMTCSARVPVYILMIGTFIPNLVVGGVLSLRALVMLALYVAGIATAMGMAWLLKLTLLKGPSSSLIIELPPYQIPAWRNTLFTVWSRSSQFLQRAGTVIFSLSIVLWFLLSYPKIDPATLGQPGQAPGISPAAGAHRDSKHDLEPGAGGSEAQIVNESSNQDKATADEAADEPSEAEKALAGAQVRYSLAGRLGRAIEPVIEPLGFNWKIGIGLVGAMAAREVFVATMGTVYSVGEADQTSVSLKDAMRRDKWPDGRPVWTTLVAVSVLVYFVLAMQCISTLSVVKQETNSWKWPLFMWAYMTGLAWLAAFAVYQGGRALGWG